MKKYDNQKTIIAIVVVALIVVFTFGSTYAFWQWRSDNSARTTVNFVISKPSMTIAGTNVSSSTLVPTANCAHATNALRGTASVAITNNTGTLLRTTIVLKGKLTPVSGRTLPATGDNSAANIHWAIKEVASATTAYAAANCNSTTNTASYATGTFSSVGSTDTDISTSITFDVSASTTTTVTKYYQLYVWIDSGYVYTTVGSTATDPMQGLRVSLTFSENSAANQVTTQ